MLLQPLWTERHEYSSTQSMEDFQAAVKNLQISRNGEINLDVKYLSSNAFMMTPKYQMLTIRSFEREESYLVGHISQDPQQRTRISVTIRANSIFLLFFCVFPLFLAVPFGFYKLQPNVNAAYIVGFTLPILVPLLMLRAAHRAKKRIREEFVSYFHLQPLLQENSNH